MQALAALHALLAALAVGWVLVRDREAFAGLTRRDVVVYVGFGPLAALVSVVAYAALGDHQFTAHEEAYHLAFLQQVPPHGWSPLETQPLLRGVYQLVGRMGDSMGLFVGVALLTGTWSAGLLGASAQLLTGRRWIGVTAALIAVLHPYSAYWRPHAFHVAAPHVIWAATLLLAVVVARRPSFRSLLAWLLVGGVATTLRQDQLFGVMATAAVPIIASRGVLVRDWKLWVPPFAIASGLLVAAIVPDMRAGVEREDFHFGLRFLGLHLTVLDAYKPLSYVTMAPLVGLGAWAASKRRDTLRNAAVTDALRTPARMFGWIALIAIFPDLLFMDFGPRHLLNTTDAGVVVALIGVAAAMEAMPARASLVRGVSAVLVVGTCLLCVQDLRDLGSRYGDPSQEVPALPGVERPTGPVTLTSDDCGAFAGEAAICDEWKWCWPLKDLRDPDNVGRFWDQHDGCVLFMVDISLDDTRGALHEWWTMVRRGYDWDPVGVMEVPGNVNRNVEVYRLRERPTRSSAQRVADEDYRKDDGK